MQIRMLMVLMAALAALASPARADAPVACGDRGELLSQLKDKYHEAPAGFVERSLMHKGFLRRYVSRPEIDGLPPGEGAFLPCTLWLADNLARQNRYAEALNLFERVFDIRNDVGLLAEEYDPEARRFLGNFPQAFSHVAVINTAHNLALAKGPAVHRAG